LRRLPSNAGILSEEEFTVVIADTYDDENDKANVSHASVVPLVLV
jgi:hypothetical protein